MKYTKGHRGSIIGFGIDILLVILPCVWYLYFVSIDRYMAAFVFFIASFIAIWRLNVSFKSEVFERLDIRMRRRVQENRNLTVVSSYAGSLSALLGWIIRLIGDDRGLFSIALIIISVLSFSFAIIATALLYVLYGKAQNVDESHL